MPYSKALQKQADTAQVRLTAISDDALGDVLAEALRRHPKKPPTTVPDWGNALQGNLAEFLIWDVGERQWKYFSRGSSTAPNAISPWRNSSDAGIDIIAARRVDGGVEIMLIEIKSSVNDGTALVMGEESTLQADFTHMYSGSVESRIVNRVGGLAAMLHYGGEEQLAIDVTACVGDSPSKCKGVWVIPTLVCSKKTKHPQRSAKLAELRKWLTDQGWPSDKIMAHVIEVDSLKDMLKRVMSEVCKP